LFGSHALSGIELESRLTGQRTDVFLHAFHHVVQSRLSHLDAIVTNFFGQAAVAFCVHGQTSEASAGITCPTQSCDQSVFVSFCCAKQFELVAAGAGYRTNVFDTHDDAFLGGL
jgi:hypothetical protein